MTKRIVVATPWESAFMLTRWVESLLDLRCPAGYEMKWVRGRGWCSARHIHSMIEQAQALRADILCFLDADVIVGPDWLESMVKHYEAGRRVVSSVVPMRGQADRVFQPFEGMAWVQDGKNLKRIDPHDGLQEIDYASAGAVMFDVTVFDEIFNPWTEERVDVANGYRREGGTPDNVLFHKFKRSGITVYADPSAKAKHLHLFEIDETFSERFKDWKQPELEPTA